VSRQHSHQPHIVPQPSTWAPAGSSEADTTPDAPAPNWWVSFWFTPESPFGLHVLRVSTGLLLIIWLLGLAADAEGVFSLNGWFDHAAFVEASHRPADIPRPFTWSLVYMCGEDASAFRAFYWASLAVLALFTLGVAPRLTAPLAWLVTLSLTANPIFEEEVEVVFRLLTLYLAVGYLLSGPWSGVSWLERIFGPWRTFLFARREGEAPPSIGANVALRLVQVHLAILLVTSALHKLQTSAWWSGVAYWYHVLPPLELSPARVKQMSDNGHAWMFFLNVAGYATLAWQLAFPAFAWRGGWWRALLLGGAALGWIGLAWLYRMPLFGPALLVSCLAFLSGAEWEQLRGWLGQAIARLTVARVARQGAITVGGN
jgi:hypothetical protein